MNYSDICNQTKTVAKEAGAYIKSQIQNLSAEDVEHKGSHDLVSFVDRAAEELIVEKLQKILPEAGILAEEGSGSSANTSLLWIIDPLDGTTNFVNGLYPHAVSIALRRNEQTVVGVVYEIGRDECFSAFEGGKAELNGRKILVNRKTNLNDALISTGFPYNDFSNQEEFLETLSYFMRETRGIRRFGSAAVDLCYFACGRFDAFYEYSLKPWDVAAGAFIAQKAGGKVSDFSGKDNYLFGREIAASSPELFEAFLKPIQHAFAKED
jgi:myo-inositol-1(or 4)-monophosphatase